MGMLRRAHRWLRRAYIRIISALKGTEKDILGWMRNAHGFEKDKMRTENGIIVFGRAFKLLEKAYVELRS